MSQSCWQRGPRVRGNRVKEGHRVLKRRSIPACTGEPLWHRSSFRLKWVYPRVYGGTPQQVWPCILRPGLSPRVRGNQLPKRQPFCASRSIPACTGNPYFRCALAVVKRSIPACTGNQLRRPRGYGVTRSIPACTGEPPYASTEAARVAVYPRVYGGTRERGPSAGHSSRSIPACTGEPHRRAPRPNLSLGLSPRVRGNRLTGQSMTATCRSIPACTGEPLVCCRIRRVIQVYPRVYGGTQRQQHHLVDSAGLSPRVRGNPGAIAKSPDCIRSIPRVRGNRRPCYGKVHATGSIPACTGEPPVRGSSVTAPSVYPRVYGGTLVDDDLAGGAARSIPACTGEPIHKVNNKVLKGVYPRVYGGTRKVCSQKPTSWGLSPRVRGNPDATDHATTWTTVYPRVYGGTRHGVPVAALRPRSIPACTGEPLVKLWTI